MGLSLEVKKFVNSENVGEFIEVELAGEIVHKRPFDAEKHPEYLNNVNDDDFDDDEFDDSVTLTKPRDNASSEVAGDDKTAGGDETADVDETVSAAPQASDVPLQTAKAAPKPRKLPKTETYVQNERVKIHYLEAGDGEPLILVHTVGQSLYTWRNVFERLSEYYRVIAIDLAGHGYSERPLTFGYTIEEQADFLRRFMDAKGIESAHFMAYSMSCAYVAKLAMDCPERIGKLIFLTPGGLTYDMPASVRMIDSAVFGFIACRLYNMSAVRKMLCECFFDLTNVNDDVVQEYYAPASDPEGRRAVKMSLQGYEDEDVCANLRLIKADSLILLGSEDKWHKPKFVEIYHTAIKSSGFSIVRNAGHLLHEEKADRVISAVLEFIPVAMPS